MRPIADQRRVRELMLAQIRAARDLAPDHVDVPRDYLHTGYLAPGSSAAVELLTGRLIDYKAEVLAAHPDSLDDAVLRALASSTSVVVPAGLPTGVTEAITAAGIDVTEDGDTDDHEPLTAVQLDRIDAVVTTAALAVASNGTIVLDAGPGQGRRIISLVPDLHVVILYADQVVETMPEAVAQLDPVRPTTLIAGPSATSDIELSRVEGVHGPRTLRVVLVSDGQPA